jgi:hypothetical protein
MNRRISKLLVGIALAKLDHALLDAARTSLALFIIFRSENIIIQNDQKRM